MTALLKVVSLLLILAILLGIVGGGVSYVGYREGLEPVTVTSTWVSTELHTSTLREVVPSTSTQLIGTTTIEQLLVLQDTVIVLEAASSATLYCGRVETLQIQLEAGEVHVKYEPDKRRTSLWLLDENDHATWMMLDENLLLHTCSKLKVFKSIIAEIEIVRTFESTVSVPSSGSYYFGFLNENDDDVTVTLNVDQGSRTEISTLTSRRTLYSTVESTSVRTETLRSATYSTHPTGLGTLYFSGIGLLVVALVFLIVSVVKRYAGRPAAPLPPVSPVTPAVSQPTASLKFCLNCGAQLRAHADSCWKCGTKQ